MFQSYEEDFLRLERELQGRLATMRSSKASARSETMRDLEKIENETDATLRHMEMEARTMPGRAAIQAKLRTYRTRFVATRSELRAHKNEADRDLLLGGRGESMSSSSREHRDRLLATTERLQDGSRRLEDAKRTALETEAIGIDVMSDLRAQRETILRTHGHVREVDENLSTSRKLLQAMSRRLVTNRIILWVVVAILILAILFVIYVKFHR